MQPMLLIGRILWVTMFLGGGLTHLTQLRGMTAYAESKEVPRPRLVVIVSGWILLLSVVMVGFGIWADAGFLIQFVWTLATATIMHDYWNLEGEDAALEQVEFMKDLSLAGGALGLFVVYTAFGDQIDYMFTGPFFDLPL